MSRRPEQLLSSPQCVQLGVENVRHFFEHLLSGIIEPHDVEVVRLRVVAISAVVLAVSGHGQRASDAIVRSSEPILFEIPHFNTTQTVLQRVLQAAGVSYGLERVPAAAGDTAVRIDRAVDRTIRLDGLAVSEALDRRLDEFAVVDRNADQILDLLLEKIGVTPVGSSAAETGGFNIEPHEQAARIAAGRSKRLSLALANVSVRDVLNAVCREHGTLSWSLEPQILRNSLHFALELSSYEGWSTGRTFSALR